VLGEEDGLAKTPEWQEAETGVPAREVRALARAWGKKRTYLAAGGLVGFGHATGGTGVRQAVDLLRQLTGTAGTYQVAVDPKRPYGLMISMGGDDKTVVAMVFKKTN